MKLDHIVYPLDLRFRSDGQGGVYSDRGEFPWHRYLDFADRITVVSRPMLPMDRPARELSLASHPSVSFVEVPSLSGPLIQFTNRPSAEAGLNEALTEADALVVRLPGEIGSVAVRVAQRLRKPWAAELIACPWDALWNYGTWQGKVYAPISWWRMRRLIRNAPFVLYVSQSFLQRRYPTRGRSVACSDVEIPELDPAVLERRLARVRAETTPVTIGLIGALAIRYKGFRTAFQALHEIRDSVPPFQFQILGAGDPSEHRRLVERLGLTDHVVFSGTRAPGEGVNEWLDGIDLYIQPSFHEGLPRALLEAMSRACPALGSTAGGTPELLPSECLHQPGDAKGLAEGLRLGVADAEWRARYARRSFEVAERYQAARLDRVRSAFWRDYVRAVRAHA